MNCPADACPAAVRRAAHAQPALSAGMTLFFAATVGVIVMDLFAAQPLTGAISADLRLPAGLTGLVAMLPQLGYAAGLVLLVPLVDLLENRRLIVATLVVCAAALALPAFTRSGAVFLAAALVAGAASSVIQMLVPMAAAMAPEAQRGRAVGNVMSGLMLGILLSRPLASLIAGTAGWRAFYVLAALADAAIAAVLALRLPSRVPSVTTGYRALLASMGRLLAAEPVLRRHALSAALAMAAFSAFWTAVGLRLAQAPFGLDLHGIALFAFAGASGAIVTPLAGRVGDRGHGPGAARRAPDDARRADRAGHRRRRLVRLRRARAPRHRAGAAGRRRGAARCGRDRRPDDRPARDQPVEPGRTRAAERPVRRTVLRRRRAGGRTGGQRVGVGRVERRVWRGVRVRGRSHRIRLVGRAPCRYRGDTARVDTTMGPD
jgi:predicted MFS family arabinose efflux permease